MNPILVSTMTKTLINGTTQSKPFPVSSTVSWKPTETRSHPRRDIFTFDSMEGALEAFAAGEFLVVMDDENRENEGDLIIAASQCTTEKMAWLIKHTRCAFLPLLLHPALVDTFHDRFHLLSFDITSC